jgi:hypothetical protein
VNAIVEDARLDGRLLTKKVVDKVSLPGAM